MSSGKTPVKKEEGSGNLDLKAVREYKQRVWVKITYDMLEVPGLTQNDEGPEEEEEEPELPKLYPVLETPLGFKRPPVLPPPPKKRKTFGRSSAINPAPNSKGFKPDWYDSVSGIELALASGPLVDDKKLREPGNIVFWTRTTGKNQKGAPKMLPQVHERVELVDLKSGLVVGTGRIAERFLTAKRVMGYVSISPLYWDPEAPFYLE